MLNRLLKRLTADELETLFKFLIDVAKGMLGVPIAFYLIKGFSPLVLVLMFVVDFILAAAIIMFAIYLHRLSKRRR